MTSIDNAIVAIKTVAIAISSGRLGWLVGLIKSFFPLLKHMPCRFGTTGCHASEALTDDGAATGIASRRPPALPLVDF